MRPGRWTAVHRPIYWNNYGIQSGRCDVIGDRRPRPLVGDVYPPPSPVICHPSTTWPQTPVRDWLLCRRLPWVFTVSTYKPLLVHFLIVNLFVCHICRYCFSTLCFRYSVSTATCFYTPPPLLQPSRPLLSLIVTNLIDRKNLSTVWCICICPLYYQSRFGISIREDNVALTTTESTPFETFGSRPGRPSESYNWHTGKFIVSIKLYPYLFLYTFIVSWHASDKKIRYNVEVKNTLIHH